MIILTGASGGIGSELVKYLLEIDEVLGIYHRSVPKSFADQRLHYEQVNLEDPNDIKLFAKKWVSRLKNITLVHAAATKNDQFALQCTLEDWDRSLRTNLTANYLLTQAILPAMIAQRWGRIIHFSSLGGIKGRPGTLAYSTCKAGLLGMSNVFAKEYARFNITSNVLILGYFNIGLFHELKDEEKNKIIESIPSRAFGNVSNIANAIEFLVKSEYVNGSTVSIDGGV